MHIAITSKRGSPLHFANLHPLIFSYFDINLEEEEKEKKKEKEKIVGRFDEKALNKLGITKDDDAWTSKVMTSKPPPFTDEIFESLCQEVKEMHAEVELLNMLAKARFKEHIKALKHTMFTIQNLGLFEFKWSSWLLGVLF